MYYVIQENTFGERSYNILIDTMKRFNFDHEIVKYKAFSGQVRCKTKRKDVFCFGAMSMAFAAKQNNWQPGSMYNKNHDMEVYGKYYDMLNGDGKVIKFSDPLPDDLPYVFFARPTTDSKVFTGQLFTKDKWNEWVQGVVESKKNLLDTDPVLEEWEGGLTNDTKFLLASTKQIQQEIRCWVVGGKVVTASRYKIGETVAYHNYDDESFYVDFANEQVKKFQVAEAFVIDVCLADDELKVIEVNNINSAGFYNANMTKLITALEDHFG